MGGAVGVSVGAAHRCAAPLLAAAIAAPALAQPSIPATTEAPARFAINAIDVVGVTRLETALVETLVYPFTGPDRSADDVEAARKALQDAYAARGYEAVVVEIPPQEGAAFQEGVIAIRVNEVPVARVRVVDSDFHSLAVVRRQFPSLAEGEPLDLKGLQRDLEDANRFPDRSITPSFRPGLVPGTIEVDLNVDSRRPLHGFVELNNDSSPSTTDLRLSAGLRYTNLWQAGHTISANYSTAPRKRSESEVLSLSYTAPFIGSPWTLLAFGYTSNSNIAALGGTNVLGDGYQIGLRAIYRLPSRGSFQSIAIGPDFKNFNQDILLEGTNVGSAPIRYLPLTIEYNLARESEFTSLDFSLGATLGLRVIKRRICIEVRPGEPCVLVDQFRNREVDSNENFVRLNASFNGQFANERDVVMALRLSGQLADSHLVTNEQFAIGGLTSVRGYFLSEAVGDDGLNGSLEVRLPSLAGWFGGPVDELRLFGFADAGIVRVQRTLPEQQSSFELAGAGGGIRLRLFDLLTGELLVAVPLTEGPDTEKGKVRASFVARGEF